MGERGKAYERETVNAGKFDTPGRGTEILIRGQEAESKLNNWDRES